jgi:hypothetical protein
MDFKFSDSVINDVTKYFGDYPMNVELVKSHKPLLANYLQGSYLKVIPFDLFNKCHLLNDYQEIVDLIQLTKNKELTEKNVIAEIKAYQELITKK